MLEFVLSPEEQAALNEGVARRDSTEAERCDADDATMTEERKTKGRSGVPIGDLDGSPTGRRAVLAIGGDCTRRRIGRRRRRCALCGGGKCGKIAMGRMDLGAGHRSRHGCFRGCSRAIGGEGPGSEGSRNL